MRIAQLQSEGLRSPGFGAPPQQAENHSFRESEIGWLFAFVYTDALLATIVKATKNSPLFHFFLAASNAYGAPYAKNAHFRPGGFERFLLVGKSPKPFESQVPCELRTLRALI